LPKFKLCDAQPSGRRFRLFSFAVNALPDALRPGGLIAKSRFIVQYPQPNGKESTVGSERETAMHGIGKSSMWTALGFAFACGLVLLQPTQASAQFNIEGIIRGAIQQQGCCYGGGGYYRNRSSGTSRHVTSHQNNDSAPAPVDKTKEKDATQLEPPSNNVANSGRQQLSGPPPSSPPETSTRPTSAAPGNDDQPAFSPSR
jgi:hypothetical protein